MFNAMYDMIVAMNTKIDELWKIAGLDITNAMTATPTARRAGAINLKLSGDGITSSTVTRL